MFSFSKKNKYLLVQKFWNFQIYICWNPKSVQISSRKRREKTLIERLSEGGIHVVGIQNIYKVKETRIGLHWDVFQPKNAFEPVFFYFCLQEYFFLFLRLVFFSRFTRRNLPFWNFQVIEILKIVRQNTFFFLLFQSERKFQKNYLLLFWKISERTKNAVSDSNFFKSKNFKTFWAKDFFFVLLFSDKKNFYLPIFSKIPNWKKKADFKYWLCPCPPVLALSSFSSFILH